MFSSKSLKKIKLIKNKQNASTPFLRRAVLTSYASSKKVRPVGYTLEYLIHTLQTMPWCRVDQVFRCFVQTWH